MDQETAIAANDVPSGVPARMAAGAAITPGLGRTTDGSARAGVDLPQRQQAAIGREGSAVEAGDDGLAGDW